MIFSIGFLAFTYQQMPDYFKKNLVSYDECTNAVVSNNLYYDIFPPRLRLNSLYPDYQNWKEGPDWQHIPPMFLYVPLPFYMMDGGPTIEVRRLSYVLVAYLLGVIFIIGVSTLFKEKRATFVASIVAWLWLLTPFVRTVLNANAFGYSDIVLAFSVVLSFLLIISLNKRVTSNLPINKNLYIFIVFAATMPLLVKNLLGALPIAFLSFVVFKAVLANKLKKREAFLSVIFCGFLCAIYYGASWWKSPEAFKAEFFVSLMHFENYEGWQKPWHYFITYYLPERYFDFMWWPFVATFVISIIIWIKSKPTFRKTILGFFFAFFMLNLIAISIVTSKSANFILQGYIFILFFVLYSFSNAVMERFEGLKLSRFLDRLYQFRESIGIITFTVFGLLVAGNVYQMRSLRINPYDYKTQNEYFFQFGELARDVLYADTKTLFILDTDAKIYEDSLQHEDPDFWFRYYILFNSGSEARRIEELRTFSNEFDVKERILKRYSHVYLVTNSAFAKSKYEPLEGEFKRYGQFEVSPIVKGNALQILDFN
jgi:hypothetical protein